MRRTYILPVVLLLVCLFGGGIWLTNSHKPVIAISPASAAENDEDVLAALSEGCANAVSSIRSGNGHATTYFWTKGGDGGVLETEAKNDLKFDGDRFLLREEVKYLTVDPTPGKEPSEAPPPTMRNTTSSYDLEKVTILDQYDTDSPTATICDPTGDRGRNQLNLYKVFARVVGHGVGYLVPRPEDLPPIIEVTSAKIVGRETINGDECIVVDVVMTMHLPEKDPIISTVRKWVNLDKGYTIVRTRTWHEGNVYSAKTLTSESSTTVRQYGDGVWGPDTYTSQNYDLEGAVRHKLVITYDPAFKLNVPVSDSELSLTLPSGTEVHNELIDAKYTVP